MAGKANFSNQKQVVKLSNGTEVTLNKINLLTTLKATEIVRDLIDQLRQLQPDLLANLFDLENGKLNIQYLNSVFPSLPGMFFNILPNVFEKVIDLASIYTNEDVETIKNEWTEEDLFTVLTPFFVHISKKINEVLSMLVKPATSNS